MTTASEQAMLNQDQELRELRTEVAALREQLDSVCMVLGASRLLRAQPWIKPNDDKWSNPVPFDISSVVDGFNRARARLGTKVDA